jgi:alginate O-acetyltransferase complex protein AlgI
MFLPLVVVGYYFLPKKYRNAFLLLASLGFYAWGEPVYVFLMLFSIVMDYIFGLCVQRYKEQKKDSAARSFVVASITGNLLILGFFKYSDFLIDTLRRIPFLSSIPDVSLGLALPIGISFYTFQTMAYTIDIYRGKVEAQKNIISFGMYVAMFPQLVAGPIIRYADIKEQIIKRVNTYEKFYIGARRFIIGLSKKVIIANTLGYTADMIFLNSALENTAATAWLGVICYSFQIYFDFSGYSDMAIGLAKMFGFDFLENFNYPYISKTVTEFWRRWHISLSSWFRDYLYIPLGGNKKGNVYVNLLVVFIITGFWHGASFNFMVWGLWHGLFLMIERVLKLRDVKKKGMIPLMRLFTLLVVVIGWVFFRVDGLKEALDYLGVMFGVIKPIHAGAKNILYYIDTKVVLTLAAAAVGSMPLIKAKAFDAMRERPAWTVLSGAAVLFLLVISGAFVVSSTYNPFIYFRF